MEKETFAQHIIQWYQKNHRDLPWRNTKEPYRIWLSEIILQQTRVKQGLPYYQRFVEQYPTVEDLAQASEQEVLRLWQGLGYYSRARNMHATAKMVVQDLGGDFPRQYQELLKLKGIGKYTAAAIASFAFDEPVAVLDGNVYRVLARFYGIDTDIASSEGNKAFSALAQELIPPDRPAIYNQALMEFGAMLCSPAKPNCLFCPLREACQAYHQGRQQELPVKINKVKIKNRYFHYLILQTDQQIALKKRAAKDIWQGLYDFYLIEKKKLGKPEDILPEALPTSLLERLNLELVSSTYKHMLTHQRIQIQFWHLRAEETFKLEEISPDLAWYDFAQVEDLPKPILIDKYLQEKFF